MAKKPDTTGQSAGKVPGKKEKDTTITRLRAWGYEARQNKGKWGKLVAALNQAKSRTAYGTILCELHGATRDHATRQRLKANQRVSKS